MPAMVRENDMYSEQGSQTGGGEAAGRAQMPDLRNQVQTLSRLLDQSRGVMEAAQKQFAYYEQQHLAKRTPESYQKAATNLVYAQSFNEVLEAIERFIPRPTVVVGVYEDLKAAQVRPTKEWGQ